MSKDTRGAEYVTTKPTDVPEIKENVSNVTFTNMPMATIPKAAFEKLSGCKTLVFINTETLQIDSDAWLGLSNLESLSIEKSAMRTLDPDMFAHLKSLTMLKVTTAITHGFWYFPRNSIPVKPFRGLDCLNSLFLSMPNLNEYTFRSMGRKVWADIGDILSELLIPGNEFTKLYSDMFIHIPKLEKLSFRNNKIRNVSPEAFNGLHLLTEIDLAKNRINEIAHDTFGTLPSLTNINLSENSIERLVDKLFGGLKKLSILKLSYNRLTAFGCKVFDSMDFSDTEGHPGKIKILD